MSVIVHWFRRDLRVADNTALAAAARDAERVVPVFILDERYARDPRVGPVRFACVREALRDLEKTLAPSGGRLIVRKGPALEALPALLAETGATAVYANREIGPYPAQRDEAAARAVEKAGGRLNLFDDELLVPPEAIATAAGAPYTVYSAFQRRWLEAPRRCLAPVPHRLDTPSLQSVPLARVRRFRDAPDVPVSIPMGERAAARHLAAFARGAARDYAERRDTPAANGTSRLSAAVHFGCVSARQVLDAIANPTLAAQIAWRDFFHHLLHHFPRVAGGSFRRKFDDLAWSRPSASFDAWKAGQTGFPLVDAGMRQLLTEHFMHNRARMTVASFLAKDLHLHWSEGERWFETQLADADLASNNGNWQWSAGAGADAAPYFRIFNPTLQARRFDAEGRYIRRYVPELVRVPTEKIHQPWRMSREQQKASGCRIGVDYPMPILDHAHERGVALRMLGGHR
jgi:deoxyribodipyrimidine photo-lyase